MDLPVRPVFLGLAVLLSACAPSDPDGLRDAGTRSDGGALPDAGHDGGGGELDAGSADAGHADAGVPEDLCALNNGGCDPLTQCSSDGDAVTCGACPSGYSGTGATGCANINECAAEPTPCSDPLRTCVDSPGSHSCDCNTGYEENNQDQCVDVDECAAGTGCHPYTTCTNTEGGFSCGPCPADYLGTGETECVASPAKLELDLASPLRSLSVCTNMPIDIPLSYDLVPVDPAAGSSQVLFEAWVTGRDGATPTLDLTRPGNVDDLVREPQYVRARGLHADIEMAMQSLTVLSRTTGNGVMTIRYCSEVTPSCSEFRAALVFDNGEQINTAFCDAPPELVAASDTVVVGDDVTGDLSPSFTVQSVPDTTLSWLRDGIVKGEVTVAADGTATFTDAVDGDVPAPGRHGYSVLHSGGAAPSAARYVILTAP